MTIASFKGKYRFLSNFAPAKIYWMYRWWPTTEHAYQAAKWHHVPEHVLDIHKSVTPGEAKKLGGMKKVEVLEISGSHTYIVRSDWDEVKLSIMEELLRLKFAIPEYREQLIETGSQELVEGNTWNDTFWGVCRGKGQNHLGKLLMKIRSEINAGAI